MGRKITEKYENVNEKHRTFQYMNDASLSLTKKLRRKIFK
jgi:hypothetical protein